MLTKSRVKYIQSLGQKKFRDDEAAFVAEGPKIVNELLNTKHIALIDLFAVPKWIEENPLIAEKCEASSMTLVDEKKLEAISFLTTPNQVLGIFRKPLFPPSDLKGKLSLVLDHIQDPGNLGTIVRIADWFGVPYIFCSPDSADVFSPKAIQATMGSIARVDVSYTALIKLLADNRSVPVYGAVVGGPALSEVGRVREGMMIIGNESKGIREELLPLLNHKVSIPKKGAAESLNAAVAAGIILSHLA